MNATVRPSGAQDRSATPQSPAVTCRDRAPGRASTTNRCDQRSTWPDPSQRQSARVIRRASGDGSACAAGRFRAGRPPTGGTSADQEARRIDLGAEGQAAAVGRPRDFGHRAMAPCREDALPAGTEIEDDQGRRRVLVGRVGAHEGDAPAVRREPAGSRRERAPWSAGEGVATRPASRGTAWRWLTYRLPRIARRTTTASRPSADRSSSSTTTCSRMSAGVMARRLGMSDRVVAPLRLSHARSAQRVRPPRDRRRRCATPWPAADRSWPSSRP